MEQENFPSQAVAMRRQLGQLSPETYNYERRQVMELILRLSFDCSRLECPLPDQARICLITGLNKSSVSRAVAALLSFGLLRRRRGADNWTLFEPRPDPDEWAGQGFEWRIADPHVRRAALAAEMALALSDGPGPEEQSSLGLQVEPTIREEFQESLASIGRQEARHQAGALPPASAERHRSSFASIKARVSGLPSVSSPANSGAPDTTSAVVSPDNCPPAGCLTRQLEPVPEAVSVSSPDNSPPKTVVSRVNQLSHQTTPRAGGRANGSPSSSPYPSFKPKLTSPSSSSMQMGKDAVGATGGNGDGNGKVDPDLVRQIRAVIGEGRWPDFQRWFGHELPKPGRQLAAREALGELKIQQDLASGGGRDRIQSPGAWFNWKFRQFAGITAKPKPKPEMSTR